MRKTIVITGVTGGIGRGLARWLAAEGHRVAGCGRREERVDALAAELGEPHDIAACDVTDDVATGAWAARVLDRVGPPDLLFNNAALMNGSRPLWEVPPEEFSLVVDVNVKGVYHVIRHFLPAMAERGAGVIVNLSSGWGRSTAPDVAPYCATKFAVEGMSRALADEIPPGLAVAAVSPGTVDTAMLRSCWGEAAGHSPRPDEWAVRAGPWLLALGPEINGRSLTVP
jgi:NAD(P)-dependent dehydrogenase (short-subunit alcohol dehydrogenase family)